MLLFLAKRNAKKPKTIFQIPGGGPSRASKYSIWFSLSPIHISFAGDFSRKFFISLLLLSPFFRLLLIPLAKPFLFKFWLSQCVDYSVLFHDELFLFCLSLNRIHFFIHFILHFASDFRSFILPLMNI